MVCVTGSGELHVQSAEEGYFLTGEAGYHAQWDSRLFNYRCVCKSAFWYHQGV